MKQSNLSEGVVRRRFRGRPSKTRQFDLFSNFDT